MPSFFGPNPTDDGIDSVSPRRMMRERQAIVHLFSSRSLYLLSEGDLEAIVFASLSNKLFIIIKENIFSRSRMIYRFTTYVVILLIKIFLES